MHISDLHLGLRLGEASFIEDQRFMLDSIVDIIAQNGVNALLIAGDIYDKSTPSAEAVALFDSFLTDLAAINIIVFIISGNHDGAKRLDYGGRLLKSCGIHIASVFDGSLEKSVLHDDYGDIFVYMLPFIKPASVRPFFPDADIHTTQEAAKLVLEPVCAELQKVKVRSVLMAHQFVISGASDPLRSDSETFSFTVGGAENLDASLFDTFSYVALGHLHKPQRAGRDTARYSGSPLKYSFSEAFTEKSAVIFSFDREDVCDLKTVPIPYLHDLRVIKGPFEALVSDEISAQGDREDYISAVLTNRELVLDPLAKLRLVYPNILKLSYEMPADAVSQKFAAAGDVAHKTAETLFAEFYETVYGEPMSVEESAIIREVLEEAGSR